MRLVIIPGFAELIIIVNPTERISREAAGAVIMPWLYAPWPNSKGKGIIEIEVVGSTLRELLNELSRKYKQADVDFEPINPKTNDLDFDYDVLVNSKNYVALVNGLDTTLADGDEVKVKMVWRWDG